MSWQNVVALAAFLIVMGIIIWLGQIGNNNEQLYIALVGLLLVIGLIGVLGSLASRGDNEELQKQYFTVIGTLVGLVGGLVGGVAIGDSAGQRAAEDVGSTLEENVESIGTQVDEVKTDVKVIKGDTTTTP